MASAATQRAARVRARRLGSGIRELFFNFINSKRPQGIEEDFGLVQIEIFVFGFNDQKEAVVGSQREPGYVEHRMIRPGQTVQREHAEDGAERGAEYGEFEGDRDEMRPAVVGFAADVERVADDVRVPLHAESGEAAEQATGKYDGGKNGAVKADGFVETVDGQRRVGVDLAESGVIGALRGFEKLLRRLEFSEQSVNGLELHDLAANLRIWIQPPREIGGARSGVQIIKQAVIARIGFKLGDPAVFVVNVAEFDGASRAGSLAGGDNLAVFHLTVLFLGQDFCGVDALHAVGAFFHHAAAAHGDVRIAHAVQAGRGVIREQKEIEAADLVRAVVRAVASADAAVVDHFVQAFRAVNRGADRADNFARRVFAVHAEHRLVVGFRRVEVAAEISVDADPLHGAAFHDLLFADHRDVVFGLAGDDAGIAANTFVQIDGHTPGIAFLFESGIQGQAFGFLFFRVDGEVGIFAIFIERGHADQIATHGLVGFLGTLVAFLVDSVLMLSDGEIIFFAGLFDAQPVGNEGRAAGANQVGVETRTAADLAGFVASVAEVESDGVISVAGNEHDSGFHFASAELQLDVIAVDDAEALRGLRADHRGVVPSEFGVGLRNFLEPAAIGEATVENGGIGFENDFEVACFCAVVGRGRYFRAGRD